MSLNVAESLLYPLSVKCIVVAGVLAAVDTALSSAMAEDTVKSLMARDTISLVLNVV